MDACAAIFTNSLNSSLLDIEELHMADQIGLVLEHLYNFFPVLGVPGRVAGEPVVVDSITTKTKTLP